jgi:hypothetical protein
MAVAEEVDLELVGMVVTREVEVELTDVAVA